MSLGKVLLRLGTTVAVASCTVSPSASPSGASGSTSARHEPPSVTPSASESEIELPALPDRGIVAMWSRLDNATGVSFLSLEGDVIATVRDVVLSQSGGPPGVVFVQRGERYWLLDATAHELRRVSAKQASKLVTRGDRVDLPAPAQSTGTWLWSTPAPTGSAVLAAYAEQESECLKPVAMVQHHPGAEPVPITGEPLARAHPSYALGWTLEGKPVAQVASGPCSAPKGGLRDGVYIFHGEGGAGAEAVDVPAGSYRFQMW